MNIEEGLRTPSKSSKSGATSSPSTAATTTTTRSSTKRATKNAKITNFFTKVSSPLTRNSSNSNQEQCENDLQQSDELSKDASSSSMKAPESCIGEICKRKGKEYVFIIPSSDDDTNTSTKCSTGRRRKPPSVHSNNSKSSDGLVLTSTNNELGLGPKRRNLSGDKQEASSNQEAASSTPTRSSGRDSRSRDSLPEKRLKTELTPTNVGTTPQNCSPSGGQRITRIQPTLIRSRTKMIDFQSVPSDLNLPRGQAANLIEKLFLVKMPEDFFLFWDFAKTINHRKPCSAFSHAYLEWNLVGPYDVLSGLITDFHGFSQENLLRHCRYYYDCPEMQTVIAKKDSSLTHYGYFRDDPDQDKPIVVMNKAAFGGQLQEVGDNLFTLLRAELDNSIINLSNSSQEIPAFSSSSTRSTRSKSNDSISKQSQLEKAKAKQELTIIRDKLIDFCSSHENISGESWSRTETRRARARSKAFHAIGLVVPKEFESRQDLGLTETKLKTMLSQISELNGDDKSKSSVHEELQDIISRVLSDNEKCNSALLLELGLNLFCQGDTFYHKDVESLLNKAYTSLGRFKFIDILKSHLELRKKGDKVSLLD